MITDSFDGSGTVVRKLSQILLLPAYWTLGLCRRDFLIRGFWHVVPLEVISHREVHLKLLTAAVKVLF